MTEQQHDSLGLIHQVIQEYTDNGIVDMVWTFKWQKMEKPDTFVNDLVTRIKPYWPQQVF